MPLDTAAALTWEPPSSWRRIRTVDAHTGGEPFRVVVEGGPALQGDTILAKRSWAQEHADDLRRLLMWEPRGHADMYGCFLTEPVTEEADFGILFIHNAGFSTMCGHGIIAATRVVIETGMLGQRAESDTLGIDSPAGLVRAQPRYSEGALSGAAFRNVPAFVVELDAMTRVPELGEVSYDLAFGGAFYAFVDAESVGLACTPEHFQKLVTAGRRIKGAIQSEREIRHPFEEDLGFLYGVIFVGPPEDPDNHSRNVCVFADGEVDRSPTGTGVSARAAIHYARGDLRLGEALEIESLVGSTFTVRAVETATFGPYEAIIPEVEGSATICGRHEFLLDPDDAFPEGFFLR